MGNRTYALLTGLFVILLGTAVVFIAWWMSGGQTQRLPYVVESRLEVFGLNDASPVFYRGVRAGRVRAIRFDPDDIGRILIDIEVDATLPITAGTWAAMRPQGVTGLTQLTLHDEGADPRRLETSPARPARIPMRPGALDRLIASGGQVLSDLERVGAGLGDLLNEDNLERVAAILENVESATGQFRDIDGRLDPLLSALPELTAETLLLLEDLRGIASGLNEVPPELTELLRELRSLSEVGHQLGAELQADLTPAIQQTLREFAASATELQRLARQLQEQPQGLLIGPGPQPPGPGEPGYREN